MDARLAKISENLVTLNNNLCAVGNHLIAAANGLEIDRANAEYRDLLRLIRENSPRRLELAGFKVYSQSDEDGIIQEIFRRIGHTNRKFVEFGVGDGQENNTLYLLAQGWSGLWIEYSQECANKIRATLPEFIERGQLTLVHRKVSPDNINEILAGSFGRNEEIDYLGVDIDGNDYHVLSRIDRINPRVVALEYNSEFPPPFRWVFPYDEDHAYTAGCRYGASLAAYEHLMASKGYRLVGCNVTGVNAFFVRADLVGERFDGPFAAETFYHPIRMHLIDRCFRRHGPFLPPPGNAFVDG